jgi:hypothetical protein
VSVFVTGHFQHFDWRGWLRVAAFAIIGCVSLAAKSSAQVVDDDELNDARQHGPSGLRTARCLIKVRGVVYLHDFCTFIPGDKKDGSFSLAASVDKRFLDFKVILSAPDSKVGVAYSKLDWDGRVELGPAHSEGACWRVGDAKGKHKETRLCAWNSLAVDQPTPEEPTLKRKDYVYYGERMGMYDGIASRAGMDTDHARIVTKKSRDAAIINCRSNHDFTVECIESVLKDAPTPTLTADCLAGTFSNASVGHDCDHCEPPRNLKMLGRNPQAGQAGQGPDILIQRLDSDNPEILDGSGASSYDSAIWAYERLCPNTKRKTPVTR